MVNNLSSLTYEQLKQNIVLLCAAKLTTPMLVVLKKQFEHEINSMRRLSYTNTLQSFIALLEKADVLNELKVDPLANIAKIVGETTAMAYVRLYENDRFYPRVQNLNNFPTFPAGKIPAQSVQNHPKSQFEARKPVEFTTEEISAKTLCFKLISEKLGTDWKRMGRALDMGEGVMDEIFRKFSDDRKKQILEMLYYLEEPPNKLSNKKHIRTHLEYGLRKVNRNDLANQVSRIYDEYS